MKKTLIILGIIFTQTCLFSQTPTVERYQAMYIYNFTKLIEWNYTTSSTFNIYINSDRNMYNEVLNIFKDKIINGKTVNVILINNLTDINGDCHILFLSKNIDSDQIVGLNNTLIVGDNKKDKDLFDVFFTLESSKLVYYLHPNKNKSLKFSSKIKELAIN